MAAMAFMTSPGYHYIFEGLNDSERHAALAQGQFNSCFQCRHGHKGWCRKFDIVIFCEKGG